MAQGLRHHLPAADVCVAATSLCGPSASETPDKPVGTVFVTVLLEGYAHEYRIQLAGTGDKLCEQAVQFVFDKLAALLDRRPALSGAAQPSSKHLASAAPARA